MHHFFFLNEIICILNILDSCNGKIRKRSPVFQIWISVHWSLRNMKGLRLIMTLVCQNLSQLCRLCITIYFLFLTNDNTYIKRGRVDLTLQYAKNNVVITRPQILIIESVLVRLRPIRTRTAISMFVLIVNRPWRCFHTWSHYQYYYYRRRWRSGDDGVPNQNAHPEQLCMFTAFAKRVLVKLIR